jgi:hypothetical protein
MTVKDTSHSISVASASGLEFASGAVFTQAAGASGNVFGSNGTANVVVFASGSSFVHQYGSNPFGLNAPSSKIVFNAGSSYVNEGGGMSLSNRTYANFIFNNNAGAASPAGSNPWTLNNLTVQDGSFTLNNAGQIVLNGTLTINSGAKLRHLNTNAAGFVLPNAAHVVNGYFGIGMPLSVTSGGTLSYGSSATLAYIGTSAQTVSTSNVELTNMPLNLSLENTAGITISTPITITGMLTLGGNNSYTNLSNITGYNGVEYAATAAQTTGAELGSSITHLTINNTAGVTVSSSKTVTGTLTLTNGLMSIGPNIFTLGASAVLAGTPSATAMIVASAGGEVRKEISSAGSFTFPIGDNSGTAEYSPIAMTVNSADAFASAYISASVTNAKHANNTSSTNFLARYWNLAASGITNPNYTAVFTYADGDINGAENQLWGGKYNGSSWTLLSVVNEAANSFTAAGISSFSDMTAGELGVMPVELSMFRAEVQRSSVAIVWSTATEVNNHGFEIQKNSSGQWEAIGFVEGAGTSNNPKEYSFIDHGTAPGKYLYRLKQIDRDGRFEYSGTVEVNVVQSIPKILSLSESFPNPFNPTTNIEFTVPNDGRASVKVYNMLGQHVAELFNDAVSAGGVYRVIFDGTRLSSGVYLSVLDFGGKYVTKRMILTK